MTTRITFHPGLNRLLLLLLFAVALAVGVAALVRVSRDGEGGARVSAPNQNTIPDRPLSAHSLPSSVILPVVPLCLGTEEPEAAWTASLATATEGQAEVSVSNGRVDVLTSDLAIEVDFVAKWHEGIGQAAHYGVATGKRPALALVLRHSQWPIRDEQISLLRQIDRVCQEQRIKLLLLVPACP